MFVARLAFFSDDWKEKGVGQVSRAIEFYGKNELWGYVSECIGGNPKIAPFLILERKNDGIYFYFSKWSRKNR